jgi:hypothetical protein
MAIVILACATTEFAGNSGGYMVAGVGQLLLLMAGLHIYFSRYSVNSPLHWRTGGAAPLTIIIRKSAMLKPAGAKDSPAVFICAKVQQQYLKSKFRKLAA